jgi:hypothetical protein
MFRWLTFMAEIALAAEWRVAKMRALSAFIGGPPSPDRDWLCDCRSVEATTTTTNKQDRRREGNTARVIIGVTFETTPLSAGR